MRLFISEFVCGGEWPDPQGLTSLAQEGRSMLSALLRDATQISGLEVAIVWDSRLAPLAHPGVRIVRPENPIEVREYFEELVAWSDATLLIAPEFDGLLTHQALLVEGIGSRLCGSSPIAIAQCSDKLLLSEILTEAGIANVETHALQLEYIDVGEITFPAVIKPRDGAGSQETYLVESTAEFLRKKELWSSSSLLRQAIWQPFLPGRPVSVGVLISPEQYRYEPLPVCEQTLSRDGRFQYHGGVLPARELDPVPIQAAAVAACRAVPGLRGYVGVDLIVPTSPDKPPYVVEINPRVTTSYLGYSHLCEQNLLERWLNPEIEQPPLIWKAGTVQYGPEGTVVPLNST